MSPAEQAAIARRTSAPVALWRLVRAIGHLFYGIWLIKVRFPGWSEAQRHYTVVWWSHDFLRKCGINLRVEGEPLMAHSVLRVSNHISWLDSFVVHASGYCRFVSKVEVKHWPLLGRLATDVGTLYLSRESRRDALRVMHDMAAALQAGDAVTVFPEGTTSDGNTLLPFHANLLQAAIAADAPVQPMAMRYVDRASGVVNPAPAYAGEDTLVQSVWRTLTAPPLDVVVNVGAVQRAEGRDRRAWTADLQAAVWALRER